MEEAYRKTTSKIMFVGEVGNEERILRIRQITMGQYDRAYDPTIPTIVHLADQKIIIAVDCRDDFNENLLGRDVINKFELTLCAKRDVVRFEWVPEEQT